MNYNTNNSGVLGNSIDIKIEPCNGAAEIRADVKVEEFDTKRIWGQILNCYNKPVGNTLIKLVKVVGDCNNKQYMGIAHTVTDCEGFYQFDVCANECHDVCYKIIVNKAITGPEMVIETGGGNCGACNGNNGACGGNSSYNPCQMPEQIVVPYVPCDETCHYPQPDSCSYPCNPCGYQKPIPCEYPQGNACNCQQPERCCVCKYPKHECKCHTGSPYVKNNYATYTR